MRHSVSVLSTLMRAKLQPVSARHVPAHKSTSVFFIGMVLDYISGLIKLSDKHEGASCAGLTIDRP